MIYLLTMVILIAQFTSLNQTISLPETRPHSQIDRLIYITDWGVTVVNDTVTVSSKNGLSESNIRIGIPGVYSSDLCYFSAKDEAGSNLIVTRSEVENDVVWLNYAFGNRESETYTFFSTTVFSNRVRFLGSAFLFNFTQSPIVESQIDLYNITIILPIDSQVSNYDNATFKRIQYGAGPALRAEFGPLSPMTQKELLFIFMSITVQIPQVTSASRKIVFSSGSIEVEDMYQIRNHGPMITSLSIRVPKNFQELTVSDSVGPIKESSIAEDQVSLAPRYGSLKTNESFTFILKYKIPLKENLRLIEWWGKYDLTFQLFTPQPFIINNLEIELIMPKGTQIENILPEPDNVSETSFEIKNVYHRFDVTPLTDLSLNIGYRYLPFWAALKPLTWIAIILAMITIFTVTFRRPLSTEQVTIPSFAKLQKYIVLQDEKTALRLELDGLMEMRNKRAVSKHEFRRRRNVIDHRLSTINREQRLLKEVIVAKLPRLRDIIEKIEKAEAEVNITRLNVANTRAQYRAGKISKESYMNLESEYGKRIERAKTALDSAIVTLKEESV